MKLINIVEALKSQGYSIKFKKRADTGIEVTEINGVKYNSRAGNKIARNLLGVSLSSKQQAHLNKLNTKLQLPSEILRKIKRTQAIIRRERAKGGRVKGTITRKQVRERLKAGASIQEIHNALNELERYAQGYAYSKNVDLLIERVNDFIEVAETFGSEHVSKLQEILMLIEQNKKYIKEANIAKIYNAFYNFSNGNLSTAELYDMIYNLIG